MKVSNALIQALQIASLLPPPNATAPPCLPLPPLFSPYMKRFKKI